MAHPWNRSPNCTRRGLSWILSSPVVSQSKPIRSQVSPESQSRQAFTSSIVSTRWSWTPSSIPRPLVLLRLAWPVLPALHAVLATDETQRPVRAVGAVDFAASTLGRQVFDLLILGLERGAPRAPRVLSPTHPP